MYNPERAGYGANARILITGATGFVGRSLVPALIGRGYALSLICRDSSDVPDEWNADPLIRLFRVPELADGAPLAAFKNVESVVHLAGLAHIGKTDQANISTRFHQANVMATQRLAEAASAARVSRFIFLSSIAAVAGNACDLTLDDQSPLQPETDFGRSKRQAERFVSELADQGIFSVSLRPPLIVGPGARGNWRSLQKLAATGLPLPFASVNNCRSFIGLDMLAQAIEWLISNDWALELSGAYCLAAPKPLSLPTVIATLRQGMAKPRRLVPCPPALFALIGAMIGHRRQISGLIGDQMIDPQRFFASFRFEPDWNLLEEIACSGARFAPDRSRVPE